MSILSWNCRGLGDSSAVPLLRDLIRSHRPDIVFLYETISTSQVMDSARHSIGFDNCLAVNRVGRSGGIVVLWMNTVNCTDTGYSRHRVDLIVTKERFGTWRLTGYYGYANRAHRKESWALLK